MNKLIVIFLMGIALTMSTVAKAECVGSAPVVFKLHQSRFSLDLWEHAKDAMNAVEITLPIGCELYNEISVGDNLVSKKFRTGSFLIHGSLGKWKLEVLSKN